MFVKTFYTKVCFSIDTYLVYRKHNKYSFSLKMSAALMLPVKRIFAEESPDQYRLSYSSAVARHLRRYVMSAKRTARFHLAIKINMCPTCR